VRRLVFGRGRAVPDDNAHGRSAQLCAKEARPRIRDVFSPHSNWKDREISIAPEQMFIGKIYQTFLFMNRKGKTDIRLCRLIWDVYEYDYAFEKGLIRIQTRNQQLKYL
jgi:hypothetical protein